MTRMESILTKSKLDFSIKFEEAILIVAAFLLSRVNVLGDLTPFGVAFLGAHIIMGYKDRKVLITSLLSIFILKGFSGMNYYIAAIIIYTFFTNYKKQREFSLINSSIITAMIFLTAGVSYTLLSKENNLYNFMMVGFESLLIFTMTYVFSFSLSVEGVGHNQMKGEKLICTFITFALMISGISNMILFDIALRNIICIAIVLYVSYTRGIYIGSTIGIVLGMITYITSPQMPYLIALLGIGGMLGGLFKELGRMGTVIGFALGNTIVSFYVNGFGTSYFNYKEIILISGLFILFGSKVETFIEKYTVKENKVKKSYEDKKFELASNKLNNTKEYLNSLCEIFEQASQEIDIFSKETIYDLIKDIEENKCAKCSNHEKCWGNQYYKTYYSLFTSIGIIESNVESSEEVINTIFDDCVEFDELYMTIKTMYNMYKKDESVNKRYMDQNRILIEQIEGLGRIIEDINLNIYKNSTFNNELEELLEKEIKDNRIDLSSVLFVQLEGDYIEIYLEFYSLNTHKRTEKIIDIVSKSLGYQVENNISYGSMENTNYLKLIRANRYNSLTKITRETSSKDDISGDSFTFGRVENTKYIAISDGMGTGDKANIESQAAIELLEKMLELGANKEMTLKTINNVLRSKSQDEIFTTLDIGFVDLYSGRLELVKSGAAPTFIKRKDECLVIDSRSLPIGIFKDVEFNIYEESLRDGDIIIMMSDGILEANKKTSDPAGWMKDLIASINSLNPQVLSDEIFNTAKLSNRNKVDDDMTLLVTKVWKDR